MENLYFNRKLFYAALIGIGGVMLIDAIPQYTRLHGEAKKWVDPALDKTGLWQGSWELFAPTPDHLNVKLRAVIQWEDGSQSTWSQPNWHTMSPWQKMRYFREMSYYDNLWRDSNAAAWEPFCRDLAETESRKSNRTPKVISLYRHKDLISVPHFQWRPAYSPPQFESTSLIYSWVPDEH